MRTHIETGERGEKQAALFLEKNGYEVVARNYRYKKAEVDLIVKKDKLLVFVEVKARSQTAYGMPEEAVTPAKVKLILSAAEEYVLATNWPHEIRFDIVSVVFGSQGTEMMHLEDAFY